MPISINHVDYSHIPVIETDRLILRRFETGDLNAVAAMWKDPRITDNIGGQPRGTSHTWSNIQQYIGSWALLGYGYLAMTERGTGAYVGQIGFMDAMRDLDPPLGSVPEAGWAVVPDVWGRGYASEALFGLLAWADAHLHSPETACMIDDDNIASVRVAEKNGYRFECEARFGDNSVNIYRRLRPDLK